MARGDRAKRLAVTVFGIGYLPVAPGTWASAAAVVIYLAMHFLYWVLFFVLGPWLMGILVLGLVAGCFTLGVRLGPWAEGHFGIEDPSPFVLDELVGQWVALLLLDSVFRVGVVVDVSAWIGGPRFFSILLIVACLVAFRIFDVLKPLGIRCLERFPGGWGIMLDDVLAGVYAGLAFWLLARFWQPPI